MAIKIKPLNKRQRELLSLLDDNYVANDFDGCDYVYRNLGDCEIWVLGGECGGPFYINAYEKSSHKRIEGCYKISSCELNVVVALLAGIVLRHKCHIVGFREENE